MFIMSLLACLWYSSFGLGTLSWHFFVKETVLRSLTICERLKVIPFFLIIILTKVWVMADLTITLHTFSYAMMVPIAAVAVIQFFLHQRMKFSLNASCLGSLANMVTIWRPTHDEAEREKTLRFYKYALQCFVEYGTDLKVFRHRFC